MASTIDGQTLFDSGPERFVVRSVGTLFVPPLAINDLQSTTTLYGDLELWIVQTGRLVAVDDDGLWDQIDAIRAQAEIPLSGSLVLPNGRTFAGMSMLRFRPESEFDRGRVVSVSYRVDYIGLA